VHFCFYCHAFSVREWVVVLAMAVRSSAQTAPSSTVSLIRLPLLPWIVGVCMRWSMVGGCCLTGGCRVTGLPVALEQMHQSCSCFV
jgi:hypothetical protein